MSDATISVTATVKYRCWLAPNFARQDVPARPRQEGFRELPTTPVGDLEPAVLDALAEAWLNDLYSKTTRASPFKRVPQ
jgi:hypothetical protein